MKRSIALLGVLLIGLVSACARIERINVTNEGAQAPTGIFEPAAIDDSGSAVAFASPDYLSTRDHEGVSDIYVRDRRHDVSELISVAADGGQDFLGAGSPSISGDGRFVAYTASAGGPLPLPPGAFGTHLYVHDRQTGALERVVVPGDGSGFSTGDATLLDQDGSHLVFAWSEPDLTPVSSVYVQDRATGEVSAVAVGPDGEVIPATPQSISDDGRHVAFTAAPADVVAGSTNHDEHLFVRDLVEGTTRWASVGGGGALPGSYGGRLSGDGTTAVLWQRQAPHHIFRKDLATGELLQVDVRECEPVTPAVQEVYPSISDDGQVIAFHSDSPDLVAGDTNGHDDVFLHRSRRPCSNERISTDRRGRQGDLDSYWPEVSGNGRVVTFVSSATNLVAADTNGRPDAFVWSVGAGSLHLADG